MKISRLMSKRTQGHLKAPVKGEISAFALKAPFHLPDVKQGRVRIGKDYVFLLSKKFAQRFAAREVPPPPLNLFQLSLMPGPQSNFAMRLR